ncbi:helicase-exonuclease AddAB subunit AddA [Bacillus sp. FJAT-22090]|uniref:helicase-exonuclease AddAB subunit AddA n=1 Tax=Bacillus sp. FJAT-22090 TaxID=1581038 RepID=UPI0011A1E5D3|nr:helicase-exonuclease AddAB subunit AddA [Bacillus sp. FJAT-22090]
MNIPNMPAELTWTPAQWKAIWATGSDVLVSAAAGSGKTAVLIDRLIQKVIAKENPINVDELLVVTFTNASAAEMRHRMGEALEKAIALDPSSAHLKKQLSLLNKAQISTLHSFCLNIVRQYSYMLTIDPGFRIANETEAALIRDDILAEVLEEAYKTENPEAMYRLSDSFTSDRDDQSIETMIEKLYTYARVHPEPKKWLLAIPEAYALDEDKTIDGLSFIEPLKLAIIHHLEEAIAVTEEIRKLANIPNGPAPLAETAIVDQQMIQEAIRLMKMGTWQDVFEYFQGITWNKAASIKKDTCDEVLKKQAVDKRNRVKKIVNELKESYFTRTPERLLEEMRMMAPLLRTLVELAVTYGERYAASKNEKGLVDFSDLEHYALEILTEQGEDGQLVPSDIAKEYKARFKEVLTDEYQDVNLLQETILQLVKSGDERTGNMFMVGDVKQSIYRFRLAEPMLFLGKYLAFNDISTDAGVKIDLNANFRSRKEVLHATNYIFQQIMGEKVGEINYDEDASLKPQAPYDEIEAPVELALLYEVEDGSVETAVDDIDEVVSAEEELKKSQAEARYFIFKIKEMIDSGKTVYDPWKKVSRPVQYSDIVILMRSMTWSQEVTDQFKEAGIPLYAELSKGYFEAIEVLIMLHTLRTIDNPYQDISLAAVLRAPFVGLTESELALIRLSAPKEPFYEALKLFVSSGGAGISTETSEKLQRFLLQFEDWRNLSRRGSLADLIWRIYLDTHYYEMVGSMPNGMQKQANLRVLHDRAIDYEKTSFRGLFRFLRFIDRMRKRGDDLGTARAMSEKENVVRLMTIHSSKGLEFPVVFLAGMGRPFNQMDFNEPYLFDQTFGLAVKAIDPEKRISFTSLPFLSMKEKKQMELKAEEMRVLYVAMTRAKEYLYLTASIKDLAKTLAKWEDAQATLPDEMLPGYVRAKAKGYLDWIGPALARHADFKQVAEVVEANIVESDSKWRIVTKCVDELKLPNDAEVKEQISLDQLTNSDQATFLPQVLARFDTVYPFELATHKRSKQSVSEIKKIQQLLEREEDTYFQMGTNTNNVAKIAKRPFFLQQEAKLTGAEVGTAVHAFMQNVDLTEVKTTEQVQAFAEQLFNREIVTKAEQKAINPEKIMRFFHSDIAERLRSSKEVMREFPFTYALEDKEGDKQIIQGIVDCLFLEEDGRWVLLDYKTDHVQYLVNDEFLLQQEMKNRYNLQLSLYAQAIETILHIEIKEKILYLFDVDKTILI